MRTLDRKMRGTGSREGQGGGRDRERGGTGGREGQGRGTGRGEGQERGGTGRGEGQGGGRAKEREGIGRREGFFFFGVKFKSIGVEPHVRPYNSVDYLRLLMPYFLTP